MEKAIKIAKPVALVLLGILPYFYGRHLSNLMMTRYFYQQGPLFLYALAMLAAWFGFGALSKALVPSKRQAILLLNAAAILALLLIFVQEVIIGHFWFNQVGIATQMFYLPMMRFGVVVVRVLPLMRGAMTLLSAISLCLMVAAAFFGRTAVDRICKAVGERR